jgi:hypothetical protein
MPRSEKKSRKREKVSARGWREEKRGGSIYLKTPEGIGFFKEEQKSYRLDFMPFIAGKGNPRADEGEEYFERTFFVHRNIGPNQEWHLCIAKTFREPCPVCEFRAQQMADPDGDEVYIKALAPKERQLWLVRNLQEDPKQTLLWEISYHLFGKQLRDKIINADEEDEYDYFADPADGKSVRVAFAQSDRGKWKEAVDIEFRQRKTSYDSDIAQEMPCLDNLLVATPYEKLKKLFLQAEESEDDGKDDDKVTEPTPTRKGRKKKEKDISVGDEVWYKSGPCEVLMVGGNGTKLKIEDIDGELYKITVDDLDENPPKKSETKEEPQEKKKDDDDDDWFDDDDEWD